MQTLSNVLVVHRSKHVCHIVRNDLSYADITVFCTDGSDHMLRAILGILLTATLLYSLPSKSSSTVLFFQYQALAGPLPLPIDCFLAVPTILLFVLALSICPCLPRASFFTNQYSAVFTQASSLSIGYSHSLRPASIVSSRIVYREVSQHLLPKFVLKQCRCLSTHPCRITMTSRCPARHQNRSSDSMLSSLR